MNITWNLVSCGFVNNVLEYVFFVFYVFTGFGMQTHISFCCERVGWLCASLLLYLIHFLVSFIDKNHKDKANFFKVGQNRRVKISQPWVGHFAISIGTAK